MPADVEHLRAVKRLEVAILVEDVVGGQERLPEAQVDAAASQQRGTVEEGASLIRRIRFGEADEHRRQIAGVARERFESLPALPHEARAEEKVARQIPDQRELRCGGEIGAAIRGLPKGIENAASVTGKIADRRVHLEQRDLHRGTLVRV